MALLHCTETYSDILSAGRQKAGNKAFNLAYLKSKCAKIEIPDSLCLLVHDDQQREYALLELKQTISQRFDYPVIIRSSSTVEDTNISCAGIFLSEICYSEIELAGSVERVINSKETEGVKRYCQKSGLSNCDVKVAVLVQPYREPCMSGVIFTKHPITNDADVIYIEYCENTSDSVTSGTQKPNCIELLKSENHNHDPTFEMQLMDIALSIERIWGHPVDIEWIMYGNAFQVVQVRQITT